VLQQPIEPCRYHTVVLASSFCFDQEAPKALPPISAPKLQIVLTTQAVGVKLVVDDLHWRTSTAWTPKFTASFDIAVLGLQT
jgi:hypothetical protein